MQEHPRITIDPNVCGGRPCIRGLRIRVSDILAMLASGASKEEILEDYPYLEPEDIAAALECDHPAQSVGLSYWGEWSGAAGGSK